MPYSLVMDFYSTKQELDEKNLNSRILSAFVLNVIRTIEPELSEYLHDQQKNKSFTLRMLYKNKYKLRLRLNLLNDTNFQKFSMVMLGASFHSFDLNGIELKVDKIICSPDSDNFWANYTNYSDLFEKADRQNTNFLFNIDSPLVFKKADSFVAFPLPELFFRSLHNRWNAHSETLFSNELLELVEKHVYSGFFELRTAVMHDNRNISFTGAIGKVEYRVSGKVSEEFIHYLNVLADYAYYAGVGAKTTMGMGQVHRINPVKSSIVSDKKRKETSEV